MLEKSRRWMRAFGGTLALLGLIGFYVIEIRDNGRFDRGLRLFPGLMVEGFRAWPGFLTLGVLMNFIANEVRPMGAWLQVIDDLKLKSGQLYESVADKLKERQVPQHRSAVVSLLQRGLLSPKRRHLRVVRDSFRFDLYGAPFGTDFGVSWRCYSKTPIAERVAMSLPFVSFLPYVLFFRNTPYHQDRGSLFQQAVHKAVRESIEEALDEQGLRLPSDASFSPSIEGQLGRLR